MEETAQASSEWEIVPVTSGNLSEVHYRASSSQGRVLFNSGKLYEFDHCTQEEANEIRNAPSANDAFNALWRGKKPYRKLN